MLVAESSSGWASAQKEDDVINLFKKAIAGAALAASALTVAAPAQARDYYRHRGNDDAAIAIGAGVVGLALGAALASSSRDRYYYDDGYYYPRQRYYRSYPRQYYYYNYDSYPRYRNYYRYDRRWDGGRRYRDYDRYEGRRYHRH